MYQTRWDEKIDWSLNHGINIIFWGVQRKIGGSNIVFVGQIQSMYLNFNYLETALHTKRINMKILSAVFGTPHQKLKCSNLKYWHKIHTRNQEHIIPITDKHRKHYRYDVELSVSRRGWRIQQLTQTACHWTRVKPSPINSTVRFRIGGTDSWLSWGSRNCRRHVQCHRQK